MLKVGREDGIWKIEVGGWGIRGKKKTGRHCGVSSCCYSLAI